MDLNGLEIKDQSIRELVGSPGRRDGCPGFTFSICAPSFSGCALPGISDPRVTADDLIQAAKEVRPSPVVKKYDARRQSAPQLQLTPFRPPRSDCRSRPALRRTLSHRLRPRSCK